MEQDLEKILEQKEIIREMRLDHKDMVMSHPNYQQIQDLKKEIKKLNDELKADEEISRMADEIANASDREKLLKEILVAKMVEEEEVKISVKGKEAVIVNNVKIQKSKG